MVSYELQIDSESHRRGAGKLLMQALDRIGRQMKMDKTILTVFKGEFGPLLSLGYAHPLTVKLSYECAANTSAIAFYEKIGFVRIVTVSVLSDGPADASSRLPRSTTPARIRAFRFSTDEIDPSNYGEQADYLILSNSYCE